MLTKIESACRTKSVCSITVQIDNDPCPEVSKFVEVAFKCKPGTCRAHSTFDGSQFASNVCGCDFH